MDIDNPNCDHMRCTFSTGEVRKVPYGSSGGNMILCNTCFVHEMAARIRHNEEHPNGPEVKVLVWEDLEIYPGD